MTDPLFVLAHAALAAVLFGSVITWGVARGLLGPTAVAVAAHVAIALAMYLTVGLWAPDAQLYDRLGALFADGWFGSGNRSVVITPGKEGFPAILAVLYGAIGHFPTLGIILNIALSSALVVIIASTTRALGGPARTAAWVTALYPPFLVWGSLLLREAMSWVLVALIVRALVGMASSDHRQARWIAVLVLATSTLLSIRGTAAILVGASALAAIAFTARNRITPLILGTVAVVLAGPALAATAGELVGGYDISSVDQTREALSRDAASAFEVRQFSSIGGLITALPLAATRGILGPFPWEWPGLSFFVIGFGILWWAVVAFLIVGIRTSTERRRLLAPLLPAATILLVLAVTSGNYGTLTRLREQATVMVLPVAVLGFTHWRASRVKSTNPDPVRDSDHPELRQRVV